MTAPPGLAPTTEPRVEQISAERVTDLSTRTQQMRFLVAELGITRPQAHRLLKAYEADLADAEKAARDRQAERFVREEFGGWLQSNYWRCVGRRPAPSLAKPWAVRSS